METFDLLQEYLSDYPGTLLLVSHDRDFLDRTTTHILAFEGEGHIQMYSGGYKDYAAQHPRDKTLKIEKKKTHPSQKNKTPEKLSYKEARELFLLPKDIEILEHTIQQWEQVLSDPSFYERDSQEFEKTTFSLQTTRHELQQKEERWIELLEKQERLEKGKAL